MQVDISSAFQDFKVIAPGAEKPIVVLRYWVHTMTWNVFYEREKNGLLTYDNSGRSAEEALEKFIRYRINGEPYVMIMGNVMLSEGTLNA